MSDKTSMSWTDWRGNTQIREVNHVIDVRNFVGSPGYALLVVAANTNLSISDILRFFWLVDVGRSRSWIQRRRWMFQPKGTDNTKAPRPDVDGKQKQAVEIMGDNPTLSVRQLAFLLKESGIKRSREWVRKHRCDSAE